MKSLKQNFTVFFSVTGVVIITKIAGLLKQIVTASQFGADVKTDIISLSEGFVSNIQYAILQAIITAFVAVYIYAKENKQKSQELISDSFKFFSTVVLFIVIIIEIVAPVISKVIAPSYTVNLAQELTKYLRIFAPILFFFTIVSLLHAILNATNKFIPGEMIGFNQSIIIIALILIAGNSIGIDVLVIGTYVYSLWNIFFLYFFCKNEAVIRRGGNPLRNPDIKKMLVMMGPLLLGYSMVFINQQVDKIIVSGMEEGTVTAMHYGAVLTNLVTTIIASICTVLFTRITEHQAQSDKEKVTSVVEKSVVIMVSIFMPIMIVAYFSADDIVRIVFGHGSFDAKAVDSAAMALRGYAFSYVPLVIKNLFCRIQYGEQKTKIPMIISSIGIVFNIIFSIILSKILGVFGVTFASSIAEFVCAVLNVFVVFRDYRYIKILSIFKKLPIILITAVVTIAVVEYLLPYLHIDNAYLHLGLTTIISFSIFLVMFFAFFRKMINSKDDYQETK